MMEEKRSAMAYPPRSSHRLVIPFLVLAVLALLAGLWAGLIRIGWTLPAQGVAMSHGPLMVSGFLGTLIALERVVALRKRWMFLVPFLSGLGWLAAMLMPGNLLGPLLITASSLGLVIIFSIIVRREPHLYTEVMAAGSVCWLAGNLLWLSGRQVFEVVSWWAAFLILTIAGERIELSRVLRTSRLQYRLFLAAGVLFLIAVAVDTWTGTAGGRLTGLAMLLLAGWLVRNDIARRNLRHPAPLTRFIALCLFLGYIWLGVSALVSLAWGGQVAGPIYDAFLHAVFVGFVLSMIFGHAPIIIPAISGALVPFSRVFYVHLFLLHASLVLRIAGDLGGWFEIRRWGGLLNEAAVLLFIFVTAAAVIRSKRGKR